MTIMNNYTVIVYLKLISRHLPERSDEINEKAQSSWTVPWKRFETRVSRHRYICLEDEKQL